MRYKIKEAAQLSNMPATTLRFYEKEGLLPYIERRESGYRVFSDDDIGILRIIECLKKTGMPIRDIRQFIDWVKEGDESLHRRHEFFLERKRVMEARMADMQKTLDLIEYKCRYYETALAAGTEKIHFKEETNSLPPHETSGGDS